MQYDLPALYEDVQISFDGGSEEDRRGVLEIYRIYMEANDIMDYDLLCTVWDGGPDNLFFNTNGYSYDGLKDWQNIWDFYRPQFKLLSEYGPGRLHVTIRGDMACIAADSIARHKDWVGGSLHHNPPFYRATKVLVRQGAAWKVVHAHFSVQGEGARPDKAQA